MVTSYLILLSKDITTPSKTISPCHKRISFSQDAYRNASGKRRLRHIRKPYTKNEIEGNEYHQDCCKDDKFEILIRQGQEKHPNYRFTYNGSHHPTEEGNQDQVNTFRLIIESEHAGRDLLKPNRSKLQAMIAKIRQGKNGPPSEPNSMAEIVLQKCQPRSRGFLVAQPRKSLDWKIQRDRQNSTKLFDTREYLICHSFRQENRNIPQTGGKIRKDLSDSHGKHSQGSINEDMMGKKLGPCNKYAVNKYRKDPTWAISKTYSQLKKSSFSFFDPNSPFKRVQTSSSFNIDTLKGWQASHEHDSALQPTQFINF